MEWAHSFGLRGAIYELIVSMTSAPFMNRKGKLRKLLKVHPIYRLCSMMLIPQMGVVLIDQRPPEVTCSRCLLALRLMLVFKEFGGGALADYVIQSNTCEPR